MLRFSRFSFSSTPTAKLRRDIITGRWVVFNVNRRNRPNQFDSEKQNFTLDPSKTSATTTSAEQQQQQRTISPAELEERKKIIRKCPFCVGNEHMTPESILMFDEDCNQIDPSSSPEAAKNWATRVVRNRYPAVSPIANNTTDDSLNDIDVLQEQAQSMALAARSGKVSEAHSSILKYNLQKKKQEKQLRKRKQEQQQQEQQHDVAAEEKLQHKKPAASATSSSSPILHTPSHLEIPALGFHEVVIETPKHFLDSPDASDPLGAHYRYSRGHVRRLLRAWHQRGQSLQEEGENSLRQIMFFKNCGMTAGASLAHDHGQIVALPIVSQDMQRQFDGHLNYFLNFQRNVFDDCVDFKKRSAQGATSPPAAADTLDEEDAEESHKNLIVYENDDFMAFVPFAAFSPFMIRIFAHNNHTRVTSSSSLSSSSTNQNSSNQSSSSGICAHFENETVEKIDSLAEVLFQVLRKLDLALDVPDFNIVVNTPPLDKRWNEYSAYNTSTFTRYFLSVTPRLGVGSVSGFEQGSGIFSNSSMPHENAELLRSIKPI